MIKTISKLIDRFKMKRWNADCLAREALDTLEQLSDLYYERYFEDSEYDNMEMVKHYDRKIEVKQLYFSQIELQLQKKYGARFVSDRLKEFGFCEK